MFDESLMHYLIVGKEVCPDTHKDHYQCFVQFRSETSIKQAQLASNTKNCHYENRRGTVQEASIYCKKEGSYTEYGLLVDRPAGKPTVEMLMKDIKEGISKFDAYEKYTSLMLQRPRFYDDYKSAWVKDNKRKRIDELQYPNVIVFYGPTGSGKSHTAYDQYPDALRISSASFKDSFPFDTYNGENTIWLEEFGAGALEYRTLLYYLDKYPATVKQMYKGYVPLKVTTWIITTCDHPNDWYLEQHDRSEFLRRMALWSIKECNYNSDTIV